MTAVSRTDKTRPALIKAADTPAYLVAEHDHRTGPCDLPPTRPAAGSISVAQKPGQTCSWVPSTHFWSSRAGRCGCSWCTGRISRRADLRRDRRREHTRIRNMRLRGGLDI
jgi:hypothetical protein